MPATTSVWHPSNARVVVLDDFLPIPRGAAIATPPTLSWPAKDPSDVLDYQIDISPALIGNAGDVIAAVDVAITPNAPGALALTSSVADGASAVLWLAGGEAEVTYSLAVIVRTANGRTIARNIQLPVRALSAPPVQSSSLLEVASGVGLTDQNGVPLTVLS